MDSQLGTGKGQSSDAIEVESDPAEGTPITEPCEICVCTEGCNKFCEEKKKEKATDEDYLGGKPLTDPCEICVCTEGCNTFCEEKKKEKGTDEDYLKSKPLTDPCKICVCTEGCNKYCEEKKKGKTAQESEVCGCTGSCVVECEGPTSSKEPITKKQDVTLLAHLTETKESIQIEKKIVKEKGREKKSFTSCKLRSGRSKIPIRKKPSEGICNVCVCEAACSPECESDKKIKGICDPCKCIDGCNSNCEQVLIAKGLLTIKSPPKVCVVCRCDSDICGPACLEAIQNKKLGILNKVTSEKSKVSEVSDVSGIREEVLASIEISPEDKICKDCRCDSGICPPLCAEAQRIRNLKSRQPTRSTMESPIIDTAVITVTEEYDITQQDRSGGADISLKRLSVSAIHKNEEDEPCDCKAGDCISECPEFKIDSHIAAKEISIEEDQLCVCTKNLPVDALLGINEPPKLSECIAECPGKAIVTDIAAKEDTKKNIQSDINETTRKPDDKQECSCRGTDEHKMMPSKKKACEQCICTGPCNRTCEEVMKIKAFADWPTATVCDNCLCKEGLCNPKCLSKRKQDKNENHVKETTDNDKAMNTVSTKLKRNKKCQCSLTNLDKSPIENEEIIIKSTKPKAHKRCQCTHVAKKDDNLAYMSELDSIMNNIKCSCLKAETINEDEKNNQHPKTNYNDYNETLILFQQKCKMKDGFIDAMIEDLRKRTTSNVFDNLLNNIANNTKSVPDFNRTLIASSLARPTPPNKCFCSSNEPVPQSKTNEQSGSPKGRLCNCTFIENDNPCPPDPLEITCIKRLGVATLMVTWASSADSRIIGYEVYINGKVKGRIFNRIRNNIVLDCLDLKNNLVINVYALTNIGRCDPPACATFVPSCHC